MADIEDDPHPQSARVARPADHEELAALVRGTLGDLTWGEAEEYAPGRFGIEAKGLKFAVLATESVFPAIRFDHRVLEVAEDSRSQAIDFANALHDRSSTLGAHWWLGDDYIWQGGVLLAAKFDEEIFLDHLWRFVEVAADRTPEIWSRFGEDWGTGDR